MSVFIAELDAAIRERRKMTSPLYQLILSGKASQNVLQTFVIQRWPIKSLWTRNILGIASQVGDYRLRSLLVENIYEEETGALSGSQRHLDTFAAFGRAVGVDPATLASTRSFPETEAVMAHNVSACNSAGAHFTAGVASVLLLMEGQPPIVSVRGSSMLSVMRDAYGLPDWGYEFFVHHASGDSSDQAVSELEDEHAAAARELLVRHCTTEELRSSARAALSRALDLRHRHFDAILREAYDPAEPPFSYQAGQS